jgi:serine/threonine protein kinase
MVLWYRPPEILLGNDHYTPAVDMWSCACIMVELLSRQPLFPGDSQIDQLFKIFRLCGTPSDEVWPDVSSLPHFLPTFPKWPRNRHALMQLISADPAALDLIERMLVYDPQRRISAHDALQHPYFAGMPPLEEPAAAHQAAVRMPWQTSAAFGGMIQPSASWEPRVQYDFAPGRESADDIPAS